MSAGGYVVTGATSGIGEEVARRLIKRGESVLAVARRRDRLEALCAESPNAHFAAVDLGLPGAVDEVCAAAKEAFGAVRGFVHCAGFAAPAPLSLVEDATAHGLYAVHALFPMRFMGWMGRMANHADGASCVLVSSIACHSGASGYAAYASAKGALEGLLKPAAAELAPRGVRVNAAAFGIVDTPMVRSSFMERSSADQIEKVRSLYPLGFGTISDAADVVEFFLGSASRWITGQILVADGGRTLA